MNTNFGLYLKEKRLKKGFTISQLNLYSGVSTAQLSRIENGKRGAPKAETIKKIASALSIPYEEMMEAAGYIEELAKSDSVEIDNEGLSVFAKRLASYLGNDNLAIQEAAEKCGVTPEYIIKLMTNPSSLPGVGTLYKLAELLNVTPDYLAGFASDPKGHDPRTPRPRDMQDFLAKEEVMLYGEILDDEDKEKLNNIMAAVFLDAKKKNKRK